MEDIRSVIASIVKGCSQAGLDVPDVLAAFVARTVVDKNAPVFSLDRKITPEQTEEVIYQSIEKLMEIDNPALEMIKMQVDYDYTYLQEENEAHSKAKVRARMIANHKSAITEVVMSDANDYEALTILYRKIFRFLVEFAPNSRAADREVEREIAAALESVFPRVGLKAFILLTRDEKTAQLMELARIIMGIRLFNRDEGRGGAGIDDMDKDSNILANVLSQDIDREVEFFVDACNKYHKAIVRAHVLHRRKHLDLSTAEHKEGGDREHLRKNTTAAAKHELQGGSTPPDATPRMVERWSQELTNRRQYLGFLRTLQAEAKFLLEKISSICDKIGIELINVRSLVSNKTSVPKEIVYPRFDALGQLWISLYDEVLTMIARSNTFQSLCKFRLSFNPTLTEEYYSDPNEFELKEAFTEKEGLQETAWEDRLQEGDDFFMAGSAIAAVSDGPPHVSSKPQETSASGARLLYPDNTPDFMLLPLELQGYCPWTIVEARGLLIAGKPVLGIVRYENLYYVFDDVVGINAFMAKPDHYLAQIRERALRNPEFIHLLRLHRWFPTASIARLLRIHELESNNKTGMPLTKDVGTGTPTHFVESFIDINYHWNEWELRRRALQIVNLKGCTTTAQQTDESHFKRTQETQVYPERVNGTQTKREKGTNPPRVTTYVVGLRGKQIMAEEKRRLQEEEEEDPRLKQDDEEDEDEGQRVQPPKQLEYPGFGIITLTTEYISNCAV